ncbi:MAG: peroxiredoxin family protein [Verrucomicrobiae bacterium]|nr:peroxiredoxin family protein [Verrucomicrobiae bacterium]
MTFKSNPRFLSGLALSLAITAATFTLHAAAPPQMGAPAPDFTLKTMDTKSVTLSAETAKLPVVLIVLRGWPGYQCPLCTKQVHEFVRQADAFAGKARVIMVYPGPAENLQAHANEFLKDKSWPNDFLFVTDPDYVFTKSYGLRWEAPGETSYPSTFLIDKKGRVQFVKISKNHGGRSTPAEILAVLAKPQ